MEFAGDNVSTAASQDLIHPTPVRKSFGELTSFLHEGDILLKRAIPEVDGGGGMESLLGRVRAWAEKQKVLKSEYLVCTAEECIPALETFDFASLVLADQGNTPSAMQMVSFFGPPDRLPLGWEVRLRFDDNPAPDETRQDFLITIAQGPEAQPVRGITLVDIFDGAGRTLANTAPALSAQGGLTTIAADSWIAAHNSGNTPRDPVKGVVVIKNEQQELKSYSFEALPTKPKETAQPVGSASAILMIAFAFLGGLALNLMPCVFPVLSLKALSVMEIGHRSPQRQTGSRQPHKIPWLRLPSPDDVAYLLGVMTTVMALGVGLVVLRSFGFALGWGSQLQSPAFNHALIFLFLFLGLGFLGAGPRVFAAGVALPSGLLKTGSQSTATAGARWWKEFLTGVLAVVVASPCTAPFMASALGFAMLTESRLESLAIFAALGFGFALPLLLLSTTPRIARLLPRPGPWVAKFEHLLGFPLLATCIWLLWISALQIEPYPWPGMLVCILIFALGARIWTQSKSQRFRVIAVLTMGAPVIVGLGFAQSAQTEAPTSQANSQAAETPRGIPFAVYSPLAVENSRAAGYPVFVDFTARWCVTCQVNKKLVFSREDVAEKLRSMGVVSFVADWTNYDPIITAELERHGRAGVPLYIVYPAAADQKPILLPQLFTPESFIQAVQAAIGEIPKE
jgi:thiol:disulfide interchange protein